MIHQESQLVTGRLNLLMRLLLLLLFAIESRYLSGLGCSNELVQLATGELAEFSIVFILQ
jgi:hypothetical protein